MSIDRSENGLVTDAGPLIIDTERRPSAEALELNGQHQFYPQTHTSVEYHHQNQLSQFANGGNQVFAGYPFEQGQYSAGYVPQGYVSKQSPPFSSNFEATQQAVMAAPRHMDPIQPWQMLGFQDNNHGQQFNQQHQRYQQPQGPQLAAHDATGQNCPPGGRPRVSTTIWEDEGTLCFQVEANNVTVARREDNNMINGTKLLNVAQMSRGKRDGILKNEASRSVIKVGSMHLKGVWIPFERALELANKNQITDHLYPLFVRDIKKFLYHPANYARTAAVLAAATQRQHSHLQQNGSGPDIGIGGIPSASMTNDDRPTLDRSLSMPTPLDRSLSMLTPPSSASTNGDYWAASPNNNVPISESQPQRSHSLPGTPATTPPAPAFFVGNSGQAAHTTMVPPYTERRPSNSFRTHYSRGSTGSSSKNTGFHTRTISRTSLKDEEMGNTSSMAVPMLQPSQYNKNHNGLHDQPSVQPDEPQYPEEGVVLESSSSVPPVHGSMERLSDAASFAHHQHQREIQGNPPFIHYSPVPASMDKTFGEHYTSEEDPATPRRSRTHSRGRSGHVFNTPNLTTQMTRRPEYTPAASPERQRAGHHVRDTSMSNSQASMWVQQQQQLVYATPQQYRGHMRQQSGQLPQIWEETPPCRSLYQLVGHNREGDYGSPQRHDDLHGAEDDRNYGSDSKAVYASNSVSYDRQHVLNSAMSPLNGKKRERAYSGPVEVGYHVEGDENGVDRAESVTPPPLHHHFETEEPKIKRRKSIRATTLPGHTKPGSRQQILQADDTKHEII